MSDPVNEFLREAIDDELTLLDAESRAVVRAQREYFEGLDKVGQLRLTAELIRIIQDARAGIKKNIKNLTLAGLEGENSAASSPEQNPESAQDIPLETLLLPIDPLAGPRLTEILKAGNIQYVGDLIQKTEHDLLTVKWVNTRRMKKIEEMLATTRLRLGTVLPAKRKSEFERAKKKAQRPAGAASRRQGKTGAPNLA